MLNDLEADTLSSLSKYLDNTTAYKIVEKKWTSREKPVLGEVPTLSAENKFQLHPSQY